MRYYMVRSYNNIAYKYCIIMQHKTRNRRSTLVKHKINRLDSTASKRLVLHTALYNTNLVLHNTVGVDIAW